MKPGHSSLFCHVIHFYTFVVFPRSVLTYYGVNAVFENAIRAALVSRRQQRFWLAGFKRVQRPLLQVSPLEILAGYTIDQSEGKKSPTFILTF